MNEQMDTQALAQALARELAPSIAPLFERAADLEALRRKPSLNSNEVEQLYGLKSTTLKTWRCRGRGPAYIKDGSVILYDQRDLLAFLEARRVRTGEQRA